MDRPPPGCWSCGAVPSEEDMRLRAVLHPRGQADGGPYARISCADCGADAVLEEVPGGEPVLAPPEAAGTSTLKNNQGFLS